MGTVVVVLVVSLVQGNLLAESPVAGRRAKFIVAPGELVLGASGCTKDIECKGDRICVKGACTAPTPEPAVSAQPPPTPAPTPPPLPPTEATSEGQILALYKDGKLADARLAAERASLSALAGKLAAVDEIYAAAAAARDARRVSTAIEKFERMLELDREVTAEANKYTRAAHRALSKLYADRSTSESPPDARASLAKAIEHNSENDTAARWLQMLNDAKAYNRVPQWPPADAPPPPVEESPSYRVRRGEQSPNGYAAQSARLLAQQENFQFQSLQQEKSLLLMQRPSVAGAVVGMVLNAALVVTWIALTAVGFFSPLLGGTLIGINVVGFVACAILAGVFGGRAARIDRRIAEINRQLGISLIPAPEPWRAIAIR